MPLGDEATEIRDATTGNRLKVNADGSIDANTTGSTPAAANGSPSQVACDNTVKTVLAANANRLGAVIQNNGLGVARITIGGTDPTSTTGLRLLPGDEMVLGRVTAIVECKREDAVSTTLDVQELTS